MGGEEVKMKGDERRVKVLPDFIIIIIIVVVVIATIITKAKISSEISAQYHQTTRRQIPEYDGKNHQSYSLVTETSKTPTFHPGSLPLGLIFGALSKIKICYVRSQGG